MHLISSSTPSCYLAVFLKVLTHNQSFLFDLSLYPFTSFKKFTTSNQPFFKHTNVYAMSASYSNHILCSTSKRTFYFSLDFTLHIYICV